MTLDITQFFIDEGIEKYTLIIILSLPIIATILTFLKYIIGLRYLKFYVPILLTVALYDLSLTSGESGLTLDPITGIKYGLPIIAIASLGVLFSYLIMEKTVMHFISKLSLIFSLSTLFVPFVYYFASTQGSIGFLASNTVSILVLVIAINLFTVTLTRRGLQYTFKTLLENIAISFGIFYLMTLESVSDFIFFHPETIIGAIISTFLIGKYSGLRLMELFRFSTLLFSEKKESKDK